MDQSQLCRTTCMCHLTGSTVGECYRLMASVALAFHETTSCFQADDAYLQSEEAWTAGIPGQPPM